MISDREKESISNAESQTGLGPSPLETSQVFVPEHSRLHTQGRVNGYIRALAEHRQGMSAKGWSQGLLQGSVLSRKCSWALPSMHYPDVLLIHKLIFLVQQYSHQVLENTLLQRQNKALVWKQLMCVEPYGLIFCTKHDLSGTVLGSVEMQQ